MALKREEATVEWLIDVLLTLHYADSHILWFGSKGSLQKERLFISPAVPVPYCSYALTQRMVKSLTALSSIFPVPLSKVAETLKDSQCSHCPSGQHCSMSGITYVNPAHHSNDMGYLHTSRAETQLNTPCWLRQHTCSCYLACTVTSKHIKCAIAHRSFLSAPQATEARTNHESEVLCTCFIF